MNPELRQRVVQWSNARQRARTDLFFLAKVVLQYKDIEEKPHREMCELMQKFPGGVDRIDPKSMTLVGYRPHKQLWELEGPRFRLMLWPRGHFKTTILTISHSIQWIINYPDVRILISTAIGEQATRMLSEMKEHFQFNERFYQLFPEFCPPRKNVMEFGNQESFTIPNRQRKWMKEPTVSVSSVGKVISSYHYEVEKFSDMVDKENVKTPNQIKEVIDHIKFCDPLLERSPLPPHHGWKDIEGTRYATGDAYGDIIRQEESAKKKTWFISVKSADPKDTPDSVPLWPTRFPLEELKRIEENDPTQYSSQYRQMPVAESSQLAAREDIVFFPRRALDGVPLRKHTTIDLHGMEDNKRNDYTVLTTCGFDRDGRVYVLDIRRGRFTPFETIAHIFDIHVKMQPLDMKIEKDAHARVLLPFLRRQMTKLGIFPNIIALPRSTKVSKAMRIRGLQAWFKGRVIRFAEDLSSKSDAIIEILNFGDASVHDDILDTLADQMQNRDGGVEGDLTPSPPQAEYPIAPPWMIDRFVGFENGRPRWLLDKETMPSVGKTGVWR
jgi:predicted phage terminase large subunit-like protein